MTKTIDMQKQNNNLVNYTNPLIDLLSVEAKNKKSFLNLIKFIKKNSTQANINDVFYSLSSDFASPKKEGLTAKVFSAESVAYNLFSQYAHYSLEDLQYFVNELQIDLTQTINSTTVYAAGSAWELYDSMGHASKIDEKQKQAFINQTEPRLLGQMAHKECVEAEKQWIGKHLFISDYHSTLADKDGEKIKYLILEIKKQFAEKNIDLEPFIKTLFKSNANYFIELFKSGKLELSRFMQQELGYDINQVFGDRPLFFHASSMAQIDYIIEKGADFNLKNKDGKNYIESWAANPEGKGVLTYLNSKSSKDVDLNSVVINFFKNDRKLGELKSIVTQLGKSLKIKDKKEILIDGNTLFYNAVRYKHWKYAFNFLEAFKDETGFTKSVANELNANQVPPFLYLLADKSSVYESTDKGGVKRIALVESMMNNFDFLQHSANKAFLKRLTKTILKMQISYMNNNQNSKIVMALNTSMKLEKDKEYADKYMDNSVFTLYNCNKNHYGSGSDLNKEIQANFINYLNVEPEYLIDLIRTSFIENAKNKNETMLFQATTDNFFFAMHLGEKIFTKDDKRKIVDMYIKNLKIFLIEAAQKLKDNKAVRFNAYGFNYTCTLAFLKAFQNLNYPIYETDLHSIKELFKVLPSDKNGAVLAEEAIVAYAEKSALENISILQSIPSSNAVDRGVGSRSKI